MDLENLLLHLYPALNNNNLAHRISQLLPALKRPLYGIRYKNGDKQMVYPIPWQNMKNQTKNPAQLRGNFEYWFLLKNVVKTRSYMAEH